MCGFVVSYEIIRVLIYKKKGGLSMDVYIILSVVIIGLIIIYILLKNEIGKTSKDTFDLEKLSLQVKNDLSGIIESNVTTKVNEVNTNLSEIKVIQSYLNDYSKEIKGLQTILGDKSSRGAFGEIELHSVLKMEYGTNEKAYQMQYNLPSGARPDAVIFAPSPLNMIAIDSKFPLENYIRMYDKGLPKQARLDARKLFVNNVRNHIKDISGKYILRGVTADMAFMFVPAEAVFLEIYSNHFKDIVLESYKYKVFIVSPTTLMAYITAVKSIYIEQDQNERVDEIKSEYGKLAQEFDRLDTRIQELSARYKNSEKYVRDLEITADKIIRKFRDIESVKLE